MITDSGMPLTVAVIIKQGCRLMYVCATLEYSPDLLVRLFHVSSAPMFENDCFTLALYTLALGISTTPVIETSVPLNRASKLQAAVL